MSRANVRAARRCRSAAFRSQAIVKDVSFDLNLGEVLGVSGLMGSGRSELARILFGLDPYSEGEIRVDDEKLPPLKPRAAMDKGVAFLTEDRRGEGLMMEASITDNIVLPSLVERSKRPYPTG